MLEKRERAGLKGIIQKLIFFGEQNRPLKDLLLVYVFFCMILLIGISTVINLFIGIPSNIILFDMIVMGAFIIFYLLANFTKQYDVIRKVFVVATFAACTYLWCATQGSSGPSIFLLQALAVVIIFISSGKELYVSLVALFIMTILLYLLEFYYPELIQHYESDNQRLLDTLSMAVLLLLFEIPLLINARNVLFKERNEAVSFAEESSYFLAKMSHEIRTPMNAITGFAELLDDPDINPVDHQYFLKILNQNSRMLLNLLNNIINVSKLNSGQTMVYYSQCNANNILVHVSETLKTLNTKEEVSVVMLENTSEDSGLFQVDQNLIYQILINIGYNALKFTTKGSVMVSWYRKGDSIIFSVKDTGKGIPIEEQRGLFDKYKQVGGQAEVNQLNGAGLGLFICKSLTDLLKGNIWFVSEEGLGTEFFVELPVDQDTEKADS
ncbi:sensor histidine kinase [Plebeiibacterium marinum]|uniref:histidine kinase n=1 Tax=Plebeiibacterium marinum TaxID=2992111 RepID=A0AAE3SIG9_9BACT|nr:HAMP domain-containing sensor histidine kinase [Plebeiobacterium marinum]MCW3804622.1 HAMP domain-containing histidine kinase [Plebeiobacterium marinum]